MARQVYAICPPEGDYRTAISDTTSSGCMSTVLGLWACLPRGHPWAAVGRGPLQSWPPSRRAYSFGNLHCGLTWAALRVRGLIQTVYLLLGAPHTTPAGGLCAGAPFRRQRFHRLRHLAAFWPVDVFCLEPGAVGARHHTVPNGACNDLVRRRLHLNTALGLVPGSSVPWPSRM